MSFLDDQATGQIGIGEKANLSTLTRRRRKRKKGQAPTGSETYSLMPQNEFSSIVSSPTDIQQVGIGNLLQAQGSSAGKVPNVFEEYKSAAPIGSTIDAIYPPPNDDDEEDDDEEEDAGTTDKLPDISPDAGEYGDPGMEGDPLGYGESAKIDPKGPLGRVLTFFEPITRTAANKMDRAIHGFPEGVTQTFNELDTDSDNKITVGDDFANYPAESSTNLVTQATIASANDYTPSISAGDDGSFGDSGSSVSTSGDWSPGSMQASGGVITKPKAKNKNSFMSMKGK
tara:strand:+ start:48 stop:902 length:855 start_codon:yes stop_codon:yes gene_type:complete